MGLMRINGIGCSQRDLDAKAGNSINYYLSIGRIFTNQNSDVPTQDLLRLINYLIESIK